MFVSDKYGKTLLPREIDMITNSIMIYESYETLGTKIRLILAKYQTPEIGYEKIKEWDEDNPIDSFMLIHESPQPKLLKQLGWDFESDSEYTKPMLVSIPRYIPNKVDVGVKPSDYRELKVQRFTKIEVFWDYERPYRIFQVNEISSNMFNPIFYYMKLAPFRYDESPDPGPYNDPNLQYTDKPGQFKYLNIGQPRVDEIKVKY